MCLIRFVSTSWVLLLLLFLFLEVCEHFDDVFGQWWRSGQMVTSRLESVLIGHPIDGDGSAIGGRVRVRALRDGANVFRLWSDLLLTSAGLYFNAIGALKTVSL